MRTFSWFWILYSIPMVLFSNPSPTKHWPIPPDELRIQDAKDRITEQNVNFPESFHLFFQGFLGDYAVFYDLNGHIAYYRYRRNQWDEENNEKYYFLLPGRSYRIQGKWIGIIYFPKDPSLKRFAPRTYVPVGDTLNWEWVKEPSTIPVFQLVQAQESYSESIIP